MTTKTEATEEPFQRLPPRGTPAHLHLCSQVRPTLHQHAGKSPLLPLSWVTYTRGQQRFSVKGQLVNILGCVSHMISVTTIQLYCRRRKAEEARLCSHKNVLTKTAFQWDLVVARPPLMQSLCKHAALPPTIKNK